MVKALEITKEQQEKIATIIKDAQAKQGALTADGGREAFAKIREELTADLAKVLTADQTEKLTKLKGKAFDVSTLGGRGGPGGGRPGGRPGAKAGEKKVD